MKKFLFLSVILGSSMAAAMNSVRLSPCSAFQVMFEQRGAELKKSPEYQALQQLKNLLSHCNDESLQMLVCLFSQARSKEGALKVIMSEMEKRENDAYAGPENFCLSGVCFRPISPEDSTPRTPGGRGTPVVPPYEK